MREVISGSLGLICNKIELWLANPREKSRHYKKLALTVKRSLNPKVEITHIPMLSEHIWVLLTLVFILTGSSVPSPYLCFKNLSSTIGRKT